uniref:hypothetical protein n=1 Tax=Areca yellow leaf disease phytoplasma TaxID=927614 RepID=UPI004040373B
MGHLSDRGLTELSRRGNLPALKKDGNDLCEPCIYGKQHRVKFASGTKQSEDVLELIHSDVWGPAPVLSRGGARYFVTFIDDFSRKLWVYLMRRKFRDCSCSKPGGLSREGDRKTCKDWLHYGGEYSSKEFRSYYEKMDQNAITQ